MEMNKSGVKKRSFMRAFFALSILFACTLLSAQDELNTENLEVVKAFEVKLAEAELIKVDPLIPTVKPIKKLYDYSISVVPLDLEYPAPVIRPLAMNDEQVIISKKYYLNLGYGTVNNPFGRLGFSLSDGDRYRVNTKIGYNAIDNSNKLDHQKSSDSRLGIDGFARLNDNVALDFDLRLKHIRRTMYADLPDYGLVDYGRQRKSDFIQGKIGFSNIDRADSDINYHIGGSVQMDNLRSDAKGVGFGITAGAEKRTSDHINIVLPMSAQFYGVDLDIEDDSQLLFHAEPKIHFQWNKFMASVGGDFYYDKELKSEIWPEIEIGYGILNNYVQVFLGAKQDFQRSDLKHLANYHPWVSLNDYQLRSTVWKDYYAGIRGELKALSYQGEIGYQSTQNQMLILDERYNDLSRQGIRFDEVTSVFIRGNVKFAISDVMEIGGNLSQHLYDSKNEEELWGLPSLQMNAFFKWDILKDKLQLTSNLFAADKVVTQDLQTGRKRELNNLIELDGELTFNVYKGFSIYAYGRNLLDNKYQRWYGYETVGINFGGGVKLIF